jgi:hypothetical protein
MTRPDGHVICQFMHAIHEMGAQVVARNRIDSPESSAPGDAEPFGAAPLASQADPNDPAFRAMAFFSELQT